MVKIIMMTKPKAPWKNVIMKIMKIMQPKTLWRKRMITPWNVEWSLDRMLKDKDLEMVVFDDTGKAAVVAKENQKDFLIQE